jgi:hypothetical protein
LFAVDVTVIDAGEGVVVLLSTIFLSVEALKVRLLNMFMYVLLSLYTTATECLVTDVVLPGVYDK